MKLRVHNLLLIVDTSFVSDPATTAAEQRDQAQGAIEHLNTVLARDGIKVVRVDAGPIRIGDAEEI